jgi:hypothetical protein
MRKSETKTSWNIICKMVKHTVSSHIHIMPLAIVVLFWMESEPGRAKKLEISCPYKPTFVASVLKLSQFSSICLLLSMHKTNLTHDTTLAMVGLQLYSLQVTQCFQPFLGQYISNAVNWVFRIRTLANLATWVCKQSFINT